MPQPLPRSFRRKLQALDAAKLDRIIGEAVDTEMSSSAGATAGGDSARLRGLPAIGRNVGGAVFGTDPVKALLAKEHRRA